MGYPPVVLQTQPLVYFPFWESQGVICHDLKNGWNGEFQNITLGYPGFGGVTSVLFESDQPERGIPFFTVNLASAWNPARGTVMIWFRDVFGAWENGEKAQILVVGNDCEYVQIWKTPGGTLRFDHNAGGVEIHAGFGFSPGPGWNSALLRWDADLGICKPFINGVPRSELGVPGIFADPPDANNTFFGRWYPGYGRWIGALNHGAIWDTMLSDDSVSKLTEVSGMVDKATFSCTHTDYDGERSTHQFNITRLTAANFDGQQTLMNTYLSALADMVEGNRYKSGGGNWVLNNIENAADQTAQRELKWLVQYHDGTTLKSYSVELPTADRTRLDPQDRAHAEIGDTDVVDAFITAFEAYALTPDGNTPIVDEITLVGRPI